MDQEKWESALNEAEETAKETLRQSQSTIEYKETQIEDLQNKLRDAQIEHAKEMEQLKSNTEQYVSYRMRDSLHALREEHAIGPHSCTHIHVLTKNLTRPHP